MRLSVIFLICVALIPQVANSQSLEKRFHVELKLGMWNQTTNNRTEPLNGSVTTSVKDNGYLTGFSLGYWPRRNLEMKFEISVLSAKAESNVSMGTVDNSAAVVTPVTFGVKYYFVKSLLASNPRPFFDIGIGMFRGSQSSIHVDTDVITESRTETASGARVGMGFDWLLGRHFLAEAAFGYNIMTDFDQPIGGSKNYSGPQFNFGIGYLFGRGVE